MGPSRDAKARCHASTGGSSCWPSPSWRCHRVTRTAGLNAAERLGRGWKGIATEDVDALVMGGRRV